MADLKIFREIKYVRTRNTHKYFCSGFRLTELDKKSCLLLVERLFRGEHHVISVYIYIHICNYLDKLNSGAHVDRDSSLKMVRII